MASASVILQLLFLLVLANGAPIIARNILGSRLARPVDGGSSAWDGRPWFGPSKTWRGLLASLAITVPAALLLGYSLETGLLLTGGAMAGDLFSSFLKRRLNIASSGQAAGLDQVPESLFPLLLIGPDLDLGHVDILVTVLAFFVVELLLSRVLYDLHIRKRPY